MVQFDVGIGSRARSLVILYVRSYEYVGEYYSFFNLKFCSEMVNCFIVYCKFLVGLEV